MILSVKCLTVCMFCFLCLETWRMVFSRDRWNREYGYALGSDFRVVELIVVRGGIPLYLTMAKTYMPMDVYLLMCIVDTALLI